MPMRMVVLRSAVVKHFSPFFHILLRPSLLLCRDNSILISCSTIVPRDSRCRRPIRSPRPPQLPPCALCADQMSARSRHQMDGPNLPRWASLPYLRRSWHRSRRGTAICGCTCFSGDNSRMARDRQVVPWRSSRGAGLIPPNFMTSSAMASTPALAGAASWSPRWYWSWRSHWSCCG